MRNLSRAKPAAAIKPPPLSAAILREQLPQMSPEDRGYVQHLLSNEQALKKVIAETEKFETDQAPLNQVVESFLSSVTNFSELDATFWQSVRLLIKQTSSRHHEAERVQNVQLFVNLFEAAKQLRPDQNRAKLLASIGQYIYRLKMLRFDPVNEAEFLDGLVQTGKPFDALRIWRSRLAREDTQYWWDIGVLYHLEAGLVHGADDLARTMQQKFPVSSRTVCELVKLHKDPAVKAHWLAQLGPDTPREQLSSLFEHLLKTGYYNVAAQLAPFDFELHFPPKDRKCILRGTTNSLAGTIVEHSPQLLESSSFFTWWVQGLLAEQSSEAGEVLSAAPPLSDAQAASLMRLAYKHNDKQVQEFLYKYQGAETASVQIQHLSSQERTDYIESLDCDLTPQLAESIVEFAPEYPRRVDYCINQQCWKLLWSSLRAGTPTHEMFGRMVKSDYTPSLNLVESVLQAFILNDDVDAAVAVLMYYEQQGLHPNRLLYSSVQVKPTPGAKFAAVSRADLPWTETVAKVPLEKFITKLGADPHRAREICATWIDV